MTTTTLILAMTCVLGTDRYALVELETPAGFPHAAVSALSDDLRAAGYVYDTSTGPRRAATWRAGELVLDVSTYTSSEGRSLGDNDALWGDAEQGTSARAFRINFQGTITDHWVVPSDPAWTSLVGGLDGQAVVRNSGGHGSSNWTGRHCRADGSVVTIEGGTGSLFPDVVGRLADGSPVAGGMMEVSGSHHAFLWYFNDGQPAIDLQVILPLATKSRMLGITEAGTICLAAADAANDWTLWRYEPLSGSLIEGPAIPRLNYVTVNSASGEIIGIDHIDGPKQPEFVVWRALPGGDVETITLPESVAFASAGVDATGTALIHVLEHPNYDSRTLLWRTGEYTLADLGDRIVGASLSGSTTVGPISPGGHLMVRTDFEGLRMAVKLSPGDVDGDGDVGVKDLLQLLKAWGPWSGPCGPDLNFDGTVNVDDVLVLLSSWSS